MSSDQRQIGFIARLFDHPHFHNLDGWRIDVLVCFIIGAIVTPADPDSIFFFVIPVLAVWMPIRYVIARRHARSRFDSPTETAEDDSY